MELKYECGQWKDNKARHFLSMAYYSLTCARGVRDDIRWKKYKTRTAINYMRLYQKRLELLFHHKGNIPKRYGVTQMGKKPPFAFGEGEPLSSKEAAQAWVDAARAREMVAPRLRCVELRAEWRENGGV